MKPQLIRTKFITSIVFGLTLAASAARAQQNEATLTEVVEFKGATANAHFRFTNGCLISRVNVSASFSFVDESGLHPSGLALEFSTFDCRLVRLIAASGFAPTNSALSVDANYQSAHIVGDLELADSVSHSLKSARVDVWLFRSGGPETYAENTVERYGGGALIEQFRGKIFPAVATGTVTFEGVEYPLEQSSSANIEAVLSSTITIER